MSAREILLAGLAADGQAANFSPVQVQKLFFLIDREIADAVAGPYFHFRPYDYGPFDSAVYSELELMSKDGLVNIARGYYRGFSLTQDGYDQGIAALNGLSVRAQDFIRRSAHWVRSVSFAQLVSAIYRKYPDMKTASVFKAVD